MRENNQGMTLHQTSLLHGTAVTKHFGGLAAVSGVDLQINEGEILGMIGPNGAGKTTLFNLISGALPLTQGRITFADVDITRSSATKRSKLGIGRTFQAGRLFPNLTTLENVGLAALFGVKQRPSYQKAMEEAWKVLMFTGLVKHATSYPGDLTQALQRRLEIARALATDPRLLLLDEVLAGLTPTEMTEGVELINQIREQGITIFIVEHIMKAIMNVSDRVIVLHHGEKIAEGSPEEIASSNLVQDVYLGEEDE
jgi:branched-chain amino acid transport system ATP-binding protein